MRLINPTQIVLPIDSPEVRDFLSFSNTSAGYQLQKTKKNLRWASYDPDGHAAAVAELESKVHRQLWQLSGDGLCTYSGLHRSLSEKYGWSLDCIKRELPSARPIPWQKIPFSMHYYQKEAHDSLLSNVHSGVSLPTGAGKSLVLLYAARNLGLKTTIVAPLSAIVSQLYEFFVEHLGSRYVGQYGDGKKVSDRLITIAVAQSLAKVQPGDDHYENFKKTQVLMFDEAHATPAQTFETVCSDLMSNAWYRFFVSATHTRTDGSEMLLEGITGPVLYQKTFQDLVSGGFLSPMRFTFFEVDSAVGAGTSDPDKETRNQLYLNPNVVKHAAKLVTNLVTAAKRPTLLILDEFKQYAEISKHVEIPHVFVHGGVTKDNKKYVPDRFHKIDTKQVVKDFNDGKIDLLIGTSAIATGVDTKRTQAIVYLQGGVSDIKIPQAIGRGTRIFPGKKDCWVFDYTIAGSPMMKRHADRRAVLYQQFGPVRYVK
jgi:superfamily II DNA or RNA helicase